MAGSRIVLTRHAEDMLIERNIEREWMETTIRQPDYVEADPTRPGVLRAFRSVIAREGRILRVAYTSDGESIRVLTVFFDRRQRR